MRPARSLTLTELLFGPALTVAAWSDQPNPGPAGTPAARRPDRPHGRDPGGLNWFLGLGLGGLAALLTGLIWDAGLHARDPELAHREGLLTLANPGHLLLFLGIVAAAVGLAGAVWARLGLVTDPRWSRRARCLLLLGLAYVTALSVTSLNRAAVAEAAAQQHGGAGRVHAAGHVHVAGADAAGLDAAADVPGHDEAGPEAAASGACRPTASQLRAAGELVADTRWGLARFADLPDALAAGYAPSRREREALKHYFNAAYVTDGRVLDPARPEGLLYAFTARGPVVVAAVYLMNRAGEPGREVGGCLTRWHVHDDLCSGDPARGAITERRGPAGRCPPGQAPWAAPPMLHTWVIDIPGPFARHARVSAVFRQLHAAPRPSPA
jgi:hypothetical protein